jgi:hypothetical protein
VGVLYGVREERREIERSLKLFKEWEDVVAVSAPCKLLICINIVVFGLNHLLYCAAMFFIFVIFRGIFDPNFDFKI